MKLTNTSKEIVNQLKGLCLQLKAEEYSKSLDLLMDNSIGKHIRHILEFYQCLMYASINGVVNYDERKHSKDIEGNPAIALSLLSDIDHWLNKERESVEVKMIVCYDNVGGESVTLETNLDRELSYNIEHAIHHMAIIRIALNMEFSHIKVPSGFGIAYSTQKFKNRPCAH